MPWCPICKNEYKEGYTQCSDCHVDLVPTLDDMPQPLIFGQEELIQAMSDLLKENDVKSFVRFDEKERQYELLVFPQDKSSAIPLLQNFMAQYEQDMQQLKAEMDEEMAEGAHETLFGKPADLHYEDKHEKALEYKSSAFALLLVGALGIVFEVLLFMDYLPIHLNGNSKILIGVVMSFMFIAFIISGFASIGSYKKGLVIAQAEADRIKEMKDMLAKKATKEILDKQLSIKENSEEDMAAYYYERAKAIKAIIREEYPDANNALVEKLSDDWYTEIYENNDSSSR